MADQTGAVDLEALKRRIEVAKATTMTSAVPGAPPLPSFVLLDVHTTDIILAALECAEEVSGRGCEFCENTMGDLGEERDGGRECLAHWWACGVCWNKSAAETSMVIGHLSDLLDRALERIPELERDLEGTRAAYRAEEARLRGVHRQALSERDDEIERLNAGMTTFRQRAERVEAATRDLYEFYGEDAEAILGPELRATLAPTPEGSE